MASIWKQQRDVTNDVNRNNFDLSFQNHSTFKFGYLYPVFCKRVYPTDSFRIRSAFDLKMMPMYFPVQSRVRAHMHFFYVRNKNLWTGWEDFITGQKSNSNHPHPYVTPSDDKVVKGSIYDYLNVPTNIFSDSVNMDCTPLNELDDIYAQRGKKTFPYRVLNIDSSTTLENAFSFTPGTSYPNNLPSLVFDNLHFGTYSSDIITLDGDLRNYLNTFLSNLSGTSVTQFVFVDDVYYTSASVPVADYVTTNSIKLKSDVFGILKSKSLAGHKVAFATVFSLSVEFDNTLLNGENISATYNADYPQGSIPLTDTGFNYYEQHQPLNAMPFRAYQSIYYGYYANDVLQPLVLNGEKEYNKFIENDADGLDTTDYHLYKRNYELDFLTSCMPSPQAGPAPLVGISALGGVTITDANGVSTGQATLDSAGNITEIVATSPIASVDHARTMMNIASLGFNINDLRSANALQRLAEQTLRSGFRYINWVKGQFGRAPEQRELDMPEFIGGYTRDIDINTITSTADTTNGAIGKDLGSLGSNGRVVGGSQHDITHYCDDYGWIIGIMSITPTPSYSQLLPKHMLAPTSSLDYANPFLNQIGMQPVTYREVCPLSAFSDSLVDPDKSIDDVFGYQRPNYDEVGAVDEVHGEFRDTLKDYLINRQFEGRPELGTDFIQVSPDEINDIFVNQNPDDDVFVGNIAFQVDAKRPFPRVHIPGLVR